MVQHQQLLNVNYTLIGFYHQTQKLYLEPHYSEFLRCYTDKKECIRTKIWSQRSLVDAWRWLFSICCNCRVTHSAVEGLCIEWGYDCFVDKYHSCKLSFSYTIFSKCDLCLYSPGVVFVNIWIGWSIQKKKLNERYNFSPVWYL